MLRACTTVTNTDPRKLHDGADKPIPPIFPTKNTRKKIFKSNDTSPHCSHRARLHPLSARRPVSPAPIADLPPPDPLRRASPNLATFILHIKIRNLHQLLESSTTPLRMGGVDVAVWTVQTGRPVVTTGNSPLPTL